MKFIAFFAFVATVGAISTIRTSSQPNCQHFDEDVINKCGDTLLLDRDVVSAQVYYEGQLIVWYKEPLCNGERYSSGGSNPCFPLPFTPRCVTIFC